MGICILFFIKLFPYPLKFFFWKAVFWQINNFLIFFLAKYFRNSDFFKVFFFIARIMLRILEKLKNKNTTRLLIRIIKKFWIPVFRNFYLKQKFFLFNFVEWVCPKWPISGRRAVREPPWHWPLPSRDAQRSAQVAVRLRIHCQERRSSGWNHQLAHRTSPSRAMVSSIKKNEILKI